MFVDRGPRFNADKFWFCQLPSASYSQIFKALLILSARFSEDNEVICFFLSFLPFISAGDCFALKAFCGTFGGRVSRNLLALNAFLANTHNLAYNKPSPRSAVSLQRFCLVSKGERGKN